MRLYFVRILPILFAISIGYHLQLINQTENIPFPVTTWSTDGQTTDTILFQQGKMLFKRYCSSCHAYKAQHRMPASNLHGLSQRWANYPRQDLIRFLQSPDSLQKEHHPAALEVLQRTPYDLSYVNARKTMPINGASQVGALQDRALSALAKYLAPASPVGTKPN